VVRVRVYQFRHIRLRRRRNSSGGIATLVDAPAAIV
jgi:hypothetical protein